MERPIVSGADLRGRITSTSPVTLSNAAPTYEVSVP